MDETIEHAINDQIARELFAAYQYLAMSAWFDTGNLPGFARWLRDQAGEEVGHATRFFDYMVESGNRPGLPSIAAPTCEFASPLAVFEAALEHEREVTRSIYALYELALDAHDYLLQMLLQWFITEQLEEEKSTGAIADRLRLGNGDGTALLIIDDELARAAAARAAAARAA